MPVIEVDRLHRHLRDSALLLVVVLLAAAILAALGAVPAMREPAALLGGLRFTDCVAPSLLAIAITASGLQTMPTTPVTHRERDAAARFVRWD